MEQAQSNKVKHIDLFTLTKCSRNNAKIGLKPLTLICNNSFVIAFQMLFEVNVKQSRWIVVKDQVLSSKAWLAVQFIPVM